MTARRKRAKARLSFAGLRKKYPNPVMAVTVTGYETDKYCVGGALCLEAGFTDLRFPKPQEIREALIKFNPSLDIIKLSDEDAERLREGEEAITKLNDVGDFEAAWTVMETLLKWHPRDRFARTKRERGDR